MLDFTYRGKVQLKLIFLEVFLKTQLFEQFFGNSVFLFLLFLSSRSRKTLHVSRLVCLTNFCDKNQSSINFRKVKKVST